MHQNRDRRRGFTVAELLIIVAIIAVLVSVAIPIFTSQLEKARQATDKANARAAYAAAIASWITDPKSETTKYVFDGSNAVIDGPAPTGYGKSSTDSSGWENMPFTIAGVPLDSYVTITIDEDGIPTLQWGDAYGYTYKSWATSKYADKTVLLTSDSAEERLAADIDIMKAIGAHLLGKTIDEIIVSTHLNPSYQGRLKNNEGVGIVTYRNQEGTNPQVRGDLSVLQEFGFSGTVGEMASNSFSDSSNRLFFSDYFNSTAEAEVMIGKVQYDSEGKANSITVWVRQIQPNASTVSVPEEFTEIVVTA